MVWPLHVASNLRSPKPGGSAAAGLAPFLAYLSVLPHARSAARTLLLPRLSSLIPFLLLRGMSCGLPEFSGSPPPHLGEFLTSPAVNADLILKKQDRLTWFTRCGASTTFQTETPHNGRIRMKRLFLGAAIVALVSVPGTASAQEHRSCKTFGQEAAATAQEFGGLGEFASAAAPANDDVAAFHAMFCD
jgi:hypothetical protein